MTPEDLVRKLEPLLTDDLRRPPWRGNPNPLAGHCYVSTEVLLHLLGLAWRPVFIRHEGSPHWFLRHRITEKVLDVTASQFRAPVPYHLGIGKGLLTKEPSARARKLLAILGSS